jgi:hypothetical protein
VLTEQQAELPRGLLLGIALVESGRGGQPNAVLLRDRNDRNHWGAEAWRRARKGGLKHAHLGCMQISVFWYGDQFPNPTAMLDPMRNVAYAAAYLRQMHARSGSMAQGGAALLRRQACRIGRLSVPCPCGADSAWCAGRSSARISPLRCTSGD